MSGGKAVAYKDAKPGDVLIFNGGSHSGIYVGNGGVRAFAELRHPVNRAKVKTWADRRPPLLSVRKPALRWADVTDFPGRPPSLIS